MSLTPILKDLHKKVTGLDITKGNVTDILRSMEENYAAQPDGGFVDPYELVYEVTIGEMVYDDHDKFYSFECQPIIEFNSEDYYLGDAKEKNTTSDQYGITWNGTPGDERVNPNEPAIGITKTGIVADEDISGQTLKIYKKVSAPSGGGKFIVPITMSQQGISSDVTLDQIKSAFDDKQSVVAQYSVGTDTAEIPLIDIGKMFVLFSGFISTGENVEIRYQTVGGWSFKRTPLKPTYVFDFTASIRDDQITFTPAEGVTYAAIAAALAETPNVYAKIVFPAALGLTISARFDESITGDDGVGYAANAVCIIGSDPVAFILSVGEDGGQTICVGRMKTLAIKST